MNPEAASLRLPTELPGLGHAFGSSCVAGMGESRPVNSGFVAKAGTVTDTMSRRGISGLVVEYIVAIDVTWAQFPADARSLQYL